MPNKSSTLETLKFALELLKRIPRSRSVTATELQQQLAEAGHHRDLRTLQRQLEELSMQFDIERDDRSKPYGYRWKPMAKGLSLPGLNEKESLLLALAEQHLLHLMPADVMKTMAPFFEQAKGNLAPHQDGRGETAAARAWLKKVRVVSTTQPLMPPPIRKGVFEAVSSALYGDLWLDVKYTNSLDRTTSTSVMPLGLAQQGTRLYLVCRFQGYDDERSLALHRMVEASVTQRRFDRPQDFDLQKYDDSGRFGFGEGKSIRLVFDIDPRAGFHLKESPLSKDQTVEERGDRLRISATVVETEQLTWWLRTFGEDVDVVTPKRRAKSVHPGR